MSKNYLLQKCRRIGVFVAGTFLFLSAQAQTTLIGGSTGNGDFETGTAGPWMVVNGSQVNKWQFSTGATPGFGGTTAAYVSNSTADPYTHTYTVGTSAVVHFYQDVAVPAGETNIKLSFSWINQGEPTYDFIKVFALPTTTTPVAGTQLTTGQVGTIAGYVGSGTWQTASEITIPSSFAGSTVRLVFSWRNDASGGTAPPGGIDDVTLISACTGAVATTATTITSSSAQLNWTGVTGSTGYTIRYRKTGEPTTVGTWTTPVTVGAGAVSTIVTGLAGGVAYEYEVAAIGPVCNAYSTSATFQTLIANDECAGALPVTVNNGSNCISVTSGTVAGATASSGPSSTCGTYDDDVWFRFVASSTSHIITLQNLGGSTTDLTFQVLSSCGATTALICSDPQSATVTGLTVGSTYYLRVASYTSTAGQTSTFDVCITVPPSQVYTSSTATQQTGTASQGSINNTILRLDVVTTNSNNPLSATQLVLNTNGTAVPADLTAARVYYTGTSTTFSTTTLFGTAVPNPSGTLAFNGSQTLATGTNYFWLVYDISCTAPVADVIDAEFTNITVGGTAYTPTTTAPTGNKTVSASSGFTSIADGNWNNPAVWACGNIPNSSTAAITINSNVTVNSIVDSSGSITVAAGKTLTIASGSLTSGRTSAGTASGNSNQLLTVNGTLTVTGGTLNINGGLRFTTTGYAFNMSGGTINIDGNDGTAAGSITSNGSIYISAIGTHNVTGGNINILDPAYSASAASAYAIGYSTPTGTGNDAVWNCTVTLGGGDDVNTANLYGYHIDCNISQGTLSLVNLVVADGNYAGKRHMETGNSTSNITSVKNLTVNTGAEVVQTTNDAVLAVTGNLVNNGTITIARTTTDRGLVLAGDVQYSGGIIFTPGTTAQSISGTGYFKKSTADAAPTAQTGNFLNSISFDHQKSSPGVTLQMPITTSALGLRGGKVNTTTTNILALGNGTSLPGSTVSFTAGAGTITMAASATVTTSATYNGGWVSGPFNRYFLAATNTGQSGIFPVGTDTSRPAQILFTTAPTTAGYLTGSWIDGYSTSTVNPALNEPAVTPSSITRVTNALWQVTNTGTLAGGTYDATFTNTFANAVLDYANTTLLKRATGASPWAIEGTHVASAGSNTAITVKRTGLTTFSQFAIGSGNTALPISLQYLKGQKAGTGNALNWKVNCTSVSITMELERSADSRSFKAITSITATQARCGQPFDYTDASPLKGTNYYRLKMIDVDGKVSYSPVVAIINGTSGAELVGIYPTVVRDEAFVSVAASRSTKLQLNITDMSGRIITTVNQTVTNGSSLININTANLSTGMYNITGMLDGVQTKTLRFVKQ